MARRYRAASAPRRVEARHRECETDCGRTQRDRTANPADLLYTKGWPTVLPTLIEAGLIADARARVSDLLSRHADHLTADSVRARRSALLEAKRMKEGKAALRRKQR